MILVINMGESRNVVDSFMNKKNLSFPVFLDEEEVSYDLIGFENIPYSLITSKEGMIQYVADGALDWNEPKVLSLIDLLLHANSSERFQ